MNHEKPNSHKGFKIVVANCEGTTPQVKSRLLKTCSHLFNDVFIAVESKLDNTIYDSEFLPSTYLDPPPSRRDRVRGGIFIATKAGLVAEPLTEFDTVCEIRWVKIQLHSLAPA